MFSDSKFRVLCFVLAFIGIPWDVPPTATSKSQFKRLTIFTHFLFAGGCLSAPLEWINSLKGKAGSGTSDLLYTQMWGEMEIFLFALWIEIASLENMKLLIEKRRLPVPSPSFLTIHLDKVLFWNMKRLILVSRMRERFVSSHLGPGSAESVIDLTFPISPHIELSLKLKTGLCLQGAMTSRFQLCLSLPSFQNALDDGVGVGHGSWRGWEWRIFGRS